MEGRLLAKARERQKAQRERNRREEDRRREEVWSKIPAVKDIDLALRRLMPGLIGLALGNRSVSAEEIQEQSDALLARRALLLRQNGLPENYLDHIYSCALCQDSGNTPEGTPCECVLTYYRREQTEELSPLLSRGSETFGTFRLDYYSDVREGNEDSPRETMARVLNTCRLYAEGFRKGSPNLLFVGQPGLGKTFLAAAIAREVAAKGHSVAYDTVSGLLAAFETEKFTRDEDDRAEAGSRTRQLLSCELLILDDLGTEMATSFSQSALYTLLDGRLRAGKQTIITTNLDIDELAARYGQALASRLRGEYMRLQFIGQDIRTIRKPRG